MDEDSAREGIRELGDLAGLEYHQSLSDVVDDPDRKRAGLRIARLIGVLIKTPMAHPVDLSEPSQATTAYRAWNLMPQAEFEAAATTGIWQYRLFETVRVELSHEERFLGEITTYTFAQYAQTETGFFGLFARALRKYICNDAVVRKQVEDAFSKVTKEMGDLKAPTPEAIVGAGGLSLGVFLVQHVPLLGMVGAPVIAGVVLLIYVLGMKAFCEMWEVTKTNEEER